MKRRYLLMLFILVLCVTACGKKQEPEEEKSLTIKEGTLLVGTHIGYAPMEYYDKDGETPIGFDVSLAEALAKEMGMELVIVPCAWDAIFSNMESKTFDAVISCVSYTSEREEKYSLTNPYLSSGLALVVPEELEVSDIQGLSGKAVGVQLDTTADYEIQKYKNNGDDIELAQYENVSNAFAALEKGSVDAVVADSVVANYFVVENKGYKVVWQSEEVDPLCICLAKENGELRDEINAALIRLQESGYLTELSEEYFGVDLTIQ